MEMVKSKRGKGELKNRNIKIDTKQIEKSERQKRKMAKMER